MTETQKELIEIKSMLEMPCKWSVGPYMDRFYAGYEGKKIEGVKCGGCGDVYVPPREMCPKCWGDRMEWVELPQRGRLVNYTVAYVDIRGKKREKPVIFGLIKLDGATTAIYGVVKGVEPEKVETGMKVKALWADEPKGVVLDVHFAPA